MSTCPAATPGAGAERDESETKATARAHVAAGSVLLSLLSFICYPQIHALADTSIVGMVGFRGTHGPHVLVTHTLPSHDPTSPPLVPTLADSQAEGALDEVEAHGLVG